MNKKIYSYYLKLTLLIGLVAVVVAILTIQTIVMVQMGSVFSSNVVPTLCDNDEILPPQRDEEFLLNLEQQISSLKQQLFGAVAVIVVVILTLVMSQVRSVFSDEDVNEIPVAVAPFKEGSLKQLLSSPKRQLLGAVAVIVVVIL